jgi:hypothetical protein
MCDHCMRHGAGGKWYLNAESYSNEVAEKYSPARSTGKEASKWLNK